MRKHSTRYTEHELAVWFEVAPLFIVSWIEDETLEAERDELGYVITNLQAAMFEAAHEERIDGARRLTATTKGFGVARATFRRLERTQGSREGDGDGD